MALKENQGISVGETLIPELEIFTVDNMRSYDDYKEKFVIQDKICSNSTLSKYLNQLVQKKIFIKVGYKGESNKRFYEVSEKHRQRIGSMKMERYIEEYWNLLTDEEKKEYCESLTKEEKMEKIAYIGVLWDIKMHEFSFIEKEINSILDFEEWLESTK